MAIMLRTVGGGGCCECAQQVDPCNCEGGCSLQCRYATGFASLCGFSEFDGAQSVPPKKYRRYTLEPQPGLPSIQNQCTHPNDACAPPDPPPDYGGISGGGGTFSILDVVQQPNGLLVVTWRATAQGGAESPSLTVSVSTNLTYYAIGYGGVPPSEHGPGTPPTSEDNTGSFIVGPGATLPVSIQQGSYGSGYAIYATKTYTFVAAPRGSKKEWYGFALINAATCEIEHNDLASLPYTGGLGCPGGVAGTAGPVDVPPRDTVTLPVRTYDQNRETQVVSATGVVTAGNGVCIDRVVWSGAITETLSDEDDEDDAIARAGGPPEEWTLVVAPQTCQTTPAFKTIRGAGDFEFSYRAVQTRGRIIGLLTPPDPIAADQNNYSPADLEGATFLRLTSTGNVTLTGLAGGTEGRRITVANVGSGYAITLADQAAGSSAENRFSVGGVPLEIMPNTSALLEYTGERWNLVSAGATATPTYNVTIKFYRRLLGSTGPWIFFSLENFTVTVDDAEEFTPWTDVPNEAGWETRAQTCELELVG